MKNKQRYATVLLEEDENGELILPLDHEIFEHLGWKEGDIVHWIANGDGSWTIKKKVESEVETGKIENPEEPSEKNSEDH